MKVKTPNGFAALLSVLVVGVIGVSITTSLLLFGVIVSRSSLVISNSAQAKALTDSCGEVALNQIRLNNSFSGNGNVTLPSGTCNYLVTVGVGQNRTINADSTINNVTRKVIISVNRITPQIQISSWQDVQ